jgi:hypothetical protein
MAAPKSRKAKKTAKPGKPAKPKADAAEEKAAERFVEDLLIRGEAAYPDAQGNLPPGATHEIVAEPGGGRSPKPPKVRRRRFSMS